jgi:hypothetical protein
MGAKPSLTLCCFLALLLAGAVLFAQPEPAPALTAPVFDNFANTATAPVCPAEPAGQGQKPDFGVDLVPKAACPASVWQACFQRYGSCTLCYCLSGSCFCENRCV